VRTTDASGVVSGHRLGIEAHGSEMRRRRRRQASFQSRANPLVPGLTGSDQGLVCSGSGSGKRMLGKSER